MSFSDLTKEQKQYMALGAVATVALVVITIFGIKVSLSSITEAKQELGDLSLKIEEADRALSKQEQARIEFAETTRKLRAILKNTPPDRNYYSWVSEIIYEQARLAGLEIDAINEQNRAAAPSGGKGNTAIKLESYSLRITARGGFGSIRGFLEQIEEGQPLARVVGVDVSSGSNPEIHDVQLFIQWPFGMGAITDAWDSIAEKKEAMDRLDPAPVEQPQPVKTVEPEAPAPVPEPAEQPDTEEPAPETIPTPAAPQPEAPELAEMVESETPVSVPEPEELPDAEEPNPKKMPPPPAPRPGAEAKDTIAEPVVSELVGPPLPDAGPEVPPDLEVVVQEEPQDSEVSAGNIQPLESSGDDIEGILEPMETDPELADEVPGTVPDGQDDPASPNGETQQEGLGKSANNPGTQTEKPQEKSDPTLEALLEMFKE